MKITPGPEELARYRKAGYKVAPVSCELLADVCTPIQAVRKLKNVSSHCFLLESAEAQENWGATRSWASTRSSRSPAWTGTCASGT